MAEPSLERNLHPTVIVRGYSRALEDALKIVDKMAFPIDTKDRQQMLNVVNSCIGTKFTNRCAARADAGAAAAVAQLCWRSPPPPPRTAYGQCACCEIVAERS